MWMSCSSAEVMELTDVADDSRASAAPPKTRSHKTMTDADFESLPVENVDWDQLGAENRDRLHDWSQRRERELINEAARCQHASSVCPVGRDRFFRRYWVFRSIAGLFVEEENAPEENIPNGNSAGENFPEEKSNKDDSHGENSLEGNSSRNNSAEEKRIGDNSHEGNSPVDKPLRENFLEVNTAGENSPRDKPVEITGVRCTDPQPMDCDPPPNVPPQTRWFVFGTPDDVDRLLGSLNARGLREGPLRATLLDQKDRLADWLNQCSPDELSTPCEDQKLSPSSENEGLLEAVQEMILDLEERLHSGSLGSLKVFRKINFLCSFFSLCSILCTVF